MEGTMEFSSGRDNSENGAENGNENESENENNKENGNENEDENVENEVGHEHEHKHEDEDENDSDSDNEGASSYVDLASLMLKPPKVVAFGNVLLDYTIPLKNMDLLKRYNMSLSTRGEKDIDTLNRITAELLATKDLPDPHLGGSALNTVRLLKELGTEPLFFGAVGTDNYAEEVQKLLRASVLRQQNYRLQKEPGEPTGRCLCFTYENSVALYANIGASSKLNKDFLFQVEYEELTTFIGPMEYQQVFYIEGFFVPHRDTVLTYIVRNFIKDRRYLAINLSAPYIVKDYFFSIIYLIQKAKIIIGNVEEFKALLAYWGGDSLEDLADELLKESTTSKILIITEGERGGRLITNYVMEDEPPGEIQYKYYKAPHVHKVIDTAGCGDAFVAGFLHAWCLEYTLDECVAYANIIAAKVAGKIGCNLE